MTHALAMNTRRAGTMKGCLIAMAVFVVIVAGVVWWVSANWRSLAVGAIKAPMIQVINDSSLPDDQKARVTAKIDTLAEDFKSGKISTDQMGKVLEAVAHSPIMPVSMVLMFDEHYVKPSKLPEAEKAAGRRTMERFARGMYEKKISEDRWNAASAPLTVPGPSGKPEFKQVVTDEELRQFLANLKAEADKAAIPDEDFKINMADELDKAIDQALGAPAK